jgi:hypothetical protein
LKRLLCGARGPKSLSPKLLEGYKFKSSKTSRETDSRKKRVKVKKKKNQTSSTFLKPPKTWNSLRELRQETLLERQRNLLLPGRRVSTFNSSSSRS